MIRQNDKVSSREIPGYLIIGHISIDKRNTVAVGGSGYPPLGQIPALPSLTDDGQPETMLIAIEKVKRRYQILHSFERSDDPEIKDVDRLWWADRRGACAGR